MRNLIILYAIIVSVGFTACGQEKDVPEKVKTAFEQRYPDATKITWEKEKNNEWEIEFKMNGKEYSSNFDNNGNWIETEYEIEESEIPANVKSTINSEFAGYEIDETEISETTDGKVYVFELEKGKSEIIVFINESGKVVKKETEDDKDEKD